MNEYKLSPDVTLSSGRTVRHSLMPNGAQSADIIESVTGEMTESEWQEYCSLQMKRVIPTGRSFK